MCRNLLSCSGLALESTPGIFFAAPKAHIKWGLRRGRRAMAAVQRKGACGACGFAVVGLLLPSIFDRTQFPLAPNSSALKVAPVGGVMVPLAPDTTA